MKINGRLIVIPTLIFVLIYLFSGCASSTKTRIVYLPAGVDTTIAATSDSLAKQLFVEWKDEELSRRLSDSAQVIFGTGSALAHALQADSSQIHHFDRDTSAVWKMLERLVPIFEKMDIIMADTALTREQLFAQLKLVFESAEELLEQAIVLDPFNLTARDNLAETYKQLAVIYQEYMYWGKAAETLSKLLEMDQSNDVIYARLADAYAQLNAWDKAFENYSLAEEVLRQSAVFSVPLDSTINDTTIAAELDSVALFDYTLNQAFANMRLFREDASISLLEKAMILAQTDEYREVVQGHFDWCKWDGGKLESADRRDSLMTWINLGRYAEAANGLKNLLPNLRTERARQEMKWQLAQVEFAKLNRREAALDTMKSVIDFYQGDSLGQELAQTDTMLTLYRNTYGTMCMDTGLEYQEERRERRIAFTYFQQAAAVPWDQQGKAYLAVAQTAVHNPMEAEKAARRALDLQNQLTDKEYKMTLELLVSSLRRQRKFDEAKTFWQQFHDVAGK